ncbi:unnamed protein product [Staurois parvus]|uniref:Uncharacterized protein n=1 Tax=Staurois parvus TaxID=386267 RepID=A0ABN9DCW2_9NEOB|nr:unnamed protein product [Staurois parvus]
MVCPPLGSLYTKLIYILPFISIASHKTGLLNRKWDMYTDHPGTDDQCALMISVAPAMPPVSVHQCQLSVLISATYQCPSVPHQCHTLVPNSAHHCHISVLI